MSLLQPSVACLRALSLPVTVVLAAVACAPASSGRGGDGNDSLPGHFGSTTSIVTIVNPIINQGSTTSVVPGDGRQGVPVVVEDSVPELRASTDETGLAVIAEVPIGDHSIRFEHGAVPVSVQQHGELYDVVVADRADGVEEVVPVVRYPIAGDVVVVEPGQSISDAAQEDGAIILLQPGTHVGDVEIRAEGVLLFGAWSADGGSASLIDGDVSWLGGNGRMRGVRVDGLLSASANGFSAAFNRLARAQITGNGVSLIRNELAGEATVPSSSAVLVDNTGIP